MKINLTGLFLLMAVLFSACSGAMYGHYPKVKSKPNASIAQNEAAQIKAEIVYIKPLPVGVTDGRSDITEVRTQFAEVKPTRQLVKNEGKASTPPGDRPADITPVNKNANIAFWSAIWALGALGAGLAISPLFIAAMVILEIMAFVFALKALKRIKRTGEYGKRKAEFALLVSLPLMFFTLILIWAIITLNSGGGGIQLGNSVWFY